VSLVVFMEEEDEEKLFPFRENRICKTILEPFAPSTKNIPLTEKKEKRKNHNPMRFAYTLNRKLIMSPS
jgi:hypothetical protein